MIKVIDSEVSEQRKRGQDKCQRKITFVKDVNVSADYVSSHRRFSRGTH